MQVVCPNCGEEFVLSADASEGDSKFITDCEICCRPMTVSIRARDGEIDSVEVTPA
ncbi:MAG TPA: CPXCG motif-containing cysteine-rich protein [Verrucomicrobiae bacterium]|nr:CPXCG motif-containing cysteine-rich protein [Verrucomicrobiae bacterium]